MKQPTRALLETAHDASEWRWLALALAVATVALYARTGSFPFIDLDDPVYVVDHPRVQHGLSGANAWWAFAAFDQANWHPLTWLSLMLDVSLFGLRPGPLHLVNVGLHVANVVLVFLTLRFLTGATRKSALVAALFAIHPAHVESVAWVVERKDVLSTFFGLLALMAYRHFACKPEVGRYSLVALAFVASLMAKSMLVTLPFLLLLLDIWPLGRLRLGKLAFPTPGPAIPRVSWYRAIGEKVPLLALSAVASALAFAAQSQGGAVVDDPNHHRFANAVVSYVRYLGKLAWPVDLAVFYPIRHEGLPAWEVAAALAGIFAISALVLWRVRQAPWLSLGWLWFLGTLVPVIGFVQVGLQAMADRYTYFPSIGLFLAVVWGLDGLRWKPWVQAAPVVAVAVLVALAVCCYRQVGFWAEDEKLFRHALSVTERNFPAHEFLAGVLTAQGRAEEARDHLLEAARIFPNAGTLTNLGSVCQKLGRPDEAERAFRFAMQLDPYFCPPVSALADLLLDSGRSAEAAEVLLGAVGGWAHRGKDSVAPRLQFGAALVDMGRVDEGITVVEAALSESPGNPEVLSSLSEAYFHRGDLERAEQLATQAVAGGARSGGALLVLGSVRMHRGDVPGAIGALEQAVQAEPEEPFRRLPLADALAQAGRLPEACANWAFVLQSRQAIATDRERASQQAKAFGCSNFQP